MTASPLHLLCASRLGADYHFRFGSGALRDEIAQNLLRQLPEVARLASLVPSFLASCSWKPFPRFRFRSARLGITQTIRGDAQCLVY